MKRGIGMIMGSVIVALVGGGAIAQGLVFNDAAYALQPAAEHDGAREGEEILRTTFKVDLKPYCPSVRQQGQVSSCVGWAVGYGAMTTQTAIMNGWEGKQEKIDENAYSSMFLYNQIRLGDCEFGAELNQAFKFIKEKGNVYYRDFASDFDCDSLPSGSLAGKAGLNRILDFSTLFYPDDKADVKVTRVKLALAQKKPVVAGMVVLQNFLSLKSDDDMWFPQIGNTDLFGGHALVVVGYDDSRKAFELMNSWGKGWANGGYVWIGYDDFAHYCKYAYLMNMEAETANYLEGKIMVRRPVAKTVGEEESHVVFTPLIFEGKDGNYKLQQGRAALPLEFQLVAEGLKSGSCLYVVSFDKKFHPTVHWPHDENLNRHLVGEYESATVHEREVIAPGKYNVFTLTEPGTEYLCVVNSVSRIKNFGKKLEQVATGKGDLAERLAKVLNNDTASEFGTYYERGKINYFGNVPDDGALSLILEFDLRK